eukprot:3994178-Pyramimonas_sp.AAC.1
MPSTADRDLQALSCQVELANQLCFTIARMGTCFRRSPEDRPLHFSCPGHWTSESDKAQTP